MKLRILLIVLLLPLFISAQDTKGEKDKKLKPYLNFWALIHMDAIYDFNQMDPDWIGGFRPSKIPIYKSDPGWGTDGHTYFSLRPSTFKFEGVMPTTHRWGDLIIRFEFDLFGMGVNAGETTFRFRIGYGRLGPWLLGKEWSTFIDLDAFPDNYEWWGPSGMALTATNMIRYTIGINSKSRLEMSFELPGSEIDAGQLREVDPTLVNLRSKQLFPDFIARYSYKGDWGYVKAAGMARILTYEAVSQNFDSTLQNSLFGWAFNLTSTLNLFTDGRLRLQTAFGQGYAGYNNDGGVEMAGNGNQKVTAPFQYGFAAFYDHYIKQRWTVSFGYSEAHQNNSIGQLGDAFRRSQYLVGQGIYEIIKGHFSVGAGIQYGVRHVKNLENADDIRLVFSARYYMSRVRDKKVKVAKPKPINVDR